MGKTRESANLVSGYNVFSNVSNNRVGIATSSPQYTLDIRGDLNFTGNLNQGGSTFVASRWSSGSGNDIYRLNGNVGVGTTNPTTLLQVNGQTGQGIRINASTGYPAFWFSQGGSDKWSITSNLNNDSSFVIRESGVADRLNILPGGSVCIGSATSTGTASQPLQVTGGAYVSGNLGIGSTNPSSRLSVGGTITELSQGQYWNVVTQADVGIGASQIPLNQHLGQLAFLDEFGNNIPQNPQTASYTLVRADGGKHISITTGGVTVPAGVFEIGDTVSIYNNSGSSQTITQGGSVTLRLAGTSSTGNRTLGLYGLCSILCVASNTFVISGAGLS